jgi:hypothetical protein
MSEGAPVTSTASFPTVNEPTILPHGKKEEYFAGCRIFDVSSDEYSKLMRGSKKWDRWNKYFDTNEPNDNCSNIRKYLYRNPSRTVVLRNMSTQDMVYFKPKGKSE